MARYHIPKVHVNRTDIQAPWKDDEIQVLLDEIEHIHSIPKLAKLHKRTPASISSKLKNIAASSYFLNPPRFYKIQSIIGIQPSEFLVKKKKVLYSPSPIMYVPIPCTVESQDPVHLDTSPILEHTDIKAKEAKEAKEAREDPDTTISDICTTITRSILEILSLSLSHLRNSNQIPH